GGIAAPRRGQQVTTGRHGPASGGLEVGGRWLRSGTVPHKTSWSPNHSVLAGTVRPARSSVRPGGGGRAPFGQAVPARGARRCDGSCGPDCPARPLRPGSLAAAHAGVGGSVSPTQSGPANL